MIRIRIEEATPSMQLARSILSSDCRILLGAGSVLTPTYIQRLRSFDIRRMWVCDDRFDDVLLLENCAPDTRLRLTVKLKAVFDDLHQDKAALKKLFARELLERLIQDVLESRNEPIPAPEDIQGETPSISHAMRVGLITASLGTLLSYSREQLMNLTVGALVHDVGKEAPLIHQDVKSEDAGHHPVDGFDAVLRARHLSATIGVVCLQHHERLDGTGWPRGLAGDAIHPFARLVAVVDRYDSLVYGSNPILPHQALAVLEQEAGIGLDANLVSLFRRYVAPYPPGTPLRLSSGEQAVVISINRMKLDRPNVRLVTKDGTTVDMNLVDKPEVHIDGIEWFIPVVSKAVAA